jgi:hypothetical protein
VNLPLPKELMATMVKELQDEFGVKHNVNIQQSGY